MAWPLAVLDGLLTGGAFLFLVVVRFDARIPESYWTDFQWFLPLAVAVSLVSNAAFGLYGEIWRFASVNEAGRVLKAGLATMVVLSTIVLLRRGDVPLSVPVAGSLLSTAGIGILRFQSRLFALNRRARDAGETRYVVVGAGTAGAQIVREMLRHRDRHEPVLVVDDDPRKHGMSLLGVPVVGSIDDLPTAVEGRDVTNLILAIPSAGPDLVARVAKLAEESALGMKVLPSVSDLVTGSVSVGDARDLRIDDLVGRHEIRTDLASVAGFLESKRVLITGAGGSIGSEIARQVAEVPIERLLLVDSDETHLHDAMATLSRDAESALVNVRDRLAVDRLVARFQPEVIFHAAALKHVPILEDHPSEAVATNVIGTENLVQAARRQGVDHFVFISTDKAVRPSSVMGASKYAGEQLVLSSAPLGSAWCCVRFGNVIGSRGSVVPTFERQIAAGGPVTVTDPRMTRFFMTISEAVQLVLQAGALATGAEIFMLDMGQQVNIDELARRMIRLSGSVPDHDVEIVYTGVRPGEKLEEELRVDTETLSLTDHPAIYRLAATINDRARVADLLADLEESRAAGDDRGVVRGLFAFALAGQGDVLIDLREASGVMSSAADPPGR